MLFWRRPPGLGRVKPGRYGSGLSANHRIPPCGTGASVVVGVLRLRGFGREATESASLRMKRWRWLLRVSFKPAD